MHVSEHNLIVLRSLDISTLEFPFPEKENGRNISVPNSISWIHRHSTHRNICVEELI